MNYTDGLFLIAFFVMAAVSATLRKCPVMREWIVIAFSICVVLTWGIEDLVLLLCSAVANYFLAIVVRKAPEPSSSRLLKLSVGFNLLFLAIFKYADFLLASSGAAIGTQATGFSLGIPIAISFYTFHLISYLVDVHARRVHLVTLRDFLFYILFFPHLIAGPIVRVWQLVPQIGVRNISKWDLAFGAHYLVLGYFLKAVAADNIGVG